MGVFSNLSALKFISAEVLIILSGIYILTNLNQLCMSNLLSNVKLFSQIV